jgi:hypothetical protein
MAVSKRLRYEVLRRDNHACRYCGASAPDVKLNVDHVIPKALGGVDTPSNLVTACTDCNAGKTSSNPDATLVAEVSDDTLRWGAAMTQAAENLRQQQKPKEEYRNAFLVEWNRWHLGKDDTNKVPLPVDWKQAIERFRVAGVPEWMWADIVDVSMANQKVTPDNTFRYCCGVAWNKVTAIQTEARRIVGAQPTGAPAVPHLPALVVAAIEIWRRETGGEGTTEREEQLTSSAIEAVNQDAEEEDILRGARYAAWFDAATISDGLRYARHDDRAAEVMRWEYAWCQSCGSYPSDGERAVFERFCDALQSAGVSDRLLATAGVVAGYSLSCVPHFGIPNEFLTAAGINGNKQAAEDLWARAFAGSAARWPTANERRKFQAQLDRLSDDGGFLVFDANASAIAAGAAQEADLYWNVPRQLSAIFAAGKPLVIGGDN